MSITIMNLAAPLLVCVLLSLAASLAGEGVHAVSIRVRTSKSKLRGAAAGPGGCHGPDCDAVQPFGSDVYPTAPPPPPDPNVYVAPTHPPTAPPTMEQHLDVIIGTPPPLPPLAVPPMAGSAPQAGALRVLPKMDP